MNRLLVSTLCLFVIVATASGEAPKLVGEKLILTRDGASDDFGRTSEWNGPGTVRLGPNGRYLLYSRKSKEMVKNDPSGQPRQRSVYRIVLRDLKTGSDKPLPIPAMLNDDPIMILMQMNMFNLAGTKIVTSAGDDGDGDGYVKFGRKSSMYPVIYDIATGKTTKLDVKDEIVIAGFDRTGKSILVLNWSDRGKTGSLQMTPVGETNFRMLSVAGLPRGLCPTADIMAMIVMPKPGADGRLDRNVNLILFDLKADRKIVDLSEQDSPMLIRFKPAWTADGRYLYYAEMQRSQPNGDSSSKGSERKLITRVWDAKKNQEVALLDGLVPIGTGPGKTTVILTGATSRRKMTGIVLHDAKSNTQHLLRDDDVRLISASSGSVIYAKKAEDGKEPIYSARIVLPKAG